VGAFYGTHNDGNIIPDLFGKALFLQKIFLNPWGRGALPKIFKSGNVINKFIIYKIS